MRKIIGYISFWGKNFSPAEAEELTGIVFSSKNEVGEIGSVGRYIGKPYDYGSGGIDFDDFEKSEDDYHLVPSKVLKYLEKYKELIESIGAEGTRIFTTVIYETQCNLEIEPDLMKRLSELGLILCLTCEQCDDIASTYR